MSEIEVGQKWIGKKFRGVVEILGYSPTLKEVWFHEENTGKSFTNQIDRFMNSYEKIEPFFEVNRSYTFRHGHPGRFVYRVVDVRDFHGKKYAVAERTGEQGVVDSSIVVLQEYKDFREV